MSSIDAMSSGEDVLRGNENSPAEEIRVCRHTHEGNHPRELPDTDVGPSDDSGVGFGFGATFEIGW